MALMRSMSMTRVLFPNFAFSHGAALPNPGPHPGMPPQCKLDVTSRADPAPRGDDKRMLWLALCVKLVCEVALLALLGRFVLGLMLGPQRLLNPFHRLLGWVVAPFERLLGAWTAAGLLLVWLAATAAKVHWCLALGPQACR